MYPPELQELIDIAFQKVQQGLTDTQKEKVESLWVYLAEDDPVNGGDLIFVFGGPEGVTRIAEAVKLYQEGISRKILFTGKKASYMLHTELTEAEFYRNEAVAQGVDEQDVILENEAHNTPENAVNSVGLLKKMGWLPRRIIQITLAYHMRRSYLTFKAVADWSPEVVHDAIPSRRFRQSDFYEKREGWEYVVFEYVKLNGARLMRHF